jgi:hypothetical protein
MEEDLKKLLEKNLAVAEETLLVVKGIRKYIFWQRIWGWVKFFIFIVLPIVLTIIYLPPLIDSFMKQYQDLMGGAGNASTINSLLKGSSAIDLKNLPPELQQLLK